MRVTGIWQTVWLEGVGSTFVADWVLRADPDSGSLDVRRGSTARTHRPSVRSWSSAAGKPVARGQASVQGNAVACSLQVPDAEAWSPDQPVLYDLELSLRTSDGKLLDRVNTYVGFRRVETKGGLYHLNGRPMFFASALDQGYYPTGLYTPPTDEDLRRDVEWAKRYGLNGVRNTRSLLSHGSTTGATGWGSWSGARCPMGRRPERYRRVPSAMVASPAVTSTIRASSPGYRPTSGPRRTILA